MIRPVILLALASVACAYEYQAIGNSLFRSYTSYVKMPITAADAEANGWYTDDTACDPVYGYAYQQKGGVKTDQPIMLYMSGAGQLAGIGMVYYQDQQPAELRDAGYMLPFGDGKHQMMSVIFRNETNMCNTDKSPLPLGDQIVINPKSSKFPGSTEANFFVPLTTHAATSMGYVKGSCFHTMGTHYMLAMSDPGSMNWKSADLSPIVPMYKADGTINAIFFASSVRQQTLLPPSTNEWDGVALPSFLMCKNWCDSSCTWDIDFWSTDHMFLNAEYESVVCDDGCSIACC